MNNAYLTEAFKSLKILDEEDFELGADAKVNELKDFLDKDEADDTIKIIDLEAETEEDLKDSYVGKVIIDCEVCHSKIYKDKDAINYNDEEAPELVNVGEECPYCYSSDGYKVIGEIAPYTEASKEEPETTPEGEEADASVEDDINASDTTADAEIKEEKICEKCGKSPCECSKEDVNESFEKVEVDTDTQHMKMTEDENGKVVVETEPKSAESTIESTDEVVQPVSMETAADIVAPETDTEVEAEIGSDEPIEMDDFDEESFDELGEAYLKNVYENVESFKTNSVNATDKGIIVEGLIKFNSGKEKKTSFVFESKGKTKTGKIRFTGLNENICRGKKAFTLTGKVTDKKLISESLIYNYRSRNNDGESTHVRGRVSR